MISHRYTDFIQKNINRFGLQLFVYCCFMSIKHIIDMFLYPQQAYSAIPKVLEVIFIYGIVVIFGASYLEYRGFSVGKAIKRILFAIIIFLSLLFALYFVTRYYGHKNTQAEEMSEKLGKEWEDYIGEIWWLP